MNSAQVRWHSCLISQIIKRLNRYLYREDNII